MKGPESFGTETPNSKNEEARPSTEGIEVEEAETVEMKGGAPQSKEELEAARKAQEQLQKDLDNTDVAEHKAEVIEMKGHAPNAEEDDVDKAA